MTDHAELPPRSFFNADDLSLLIMEHPDAPQFLAVKIADAHDAALAALVAERDALAAEVSKLRTPEWFYNACGLAHPSDAAQAAPEED